MIDDIYVHEWAEIWLSTYKANVEYNTLLRYKAIIKNQINPFIGKCKLRELNLNMVQTFINDISATYSQSTLKKVKITLNQMCRCAVLTGRIASNPTQGLVIPKSNLEKYNTDCEKFIPDDIVIMLNDFCKNYKYGAFIYKAGVDLKTAQSYLGHSSISVTMDIYTHLDQQQKKINADRLNDFIKNNVSVE